MAINIEQFCKKAQLGDDESKVSILEALCPIIKNQWANNKFSGGDSRLSLIPDDELLEDKLLKTENRKLLSEALAKLTLEQKEMLHYLYFMKMSLKMYSDWTGIKYITLIKRRDALLKNLKASLYEDFYPIRYEKEI